MPIRIMRRKIIIMMIMIIIMVTVSLFPKIWSNLYQYWCYASTPRCRDTKYKYLLYLGAARLRSRRKEGIDLWLENLHSSIHLLGLLKVLFAYVDFAGLDAMTPLVGEYILVGCSIPTLRAILISFFNIRCIFTLIPVLRRGKILPRSLKKLDKSLRST